MEYVNPLDIYFTSKGMLPEEGEFVTANWGRKFVHNALSAYGMIGTMIFTGKMPEEIDPVSLQKCEKASINLGLTKKFKFPPHVELYYGTTNNLLPTTKIEGGYFLRKPSWYITGDMLTICNPVPDLQYVYYRIFGV